MVDFSLLTDPHNSVVRKEIGPAVVGLTVLEYATDLWVSLFAKPPV